MTRLFGPLVSWEFTRLSRSGQAARVRVLFLYVLLFTVVGFAVVAGYFSGDRDPFRLLVGHGEPASTREEPVLGSWLALVLLEVQLLFVAAIMPAYAAAAVAEEKDRRTLSMLLATQLTDREIVWGKVVARTLFILAAVAAGIPVLVLTMLFGGVELGFVAAGYALAAGTAVLAAAIGMNAACHAPDTRTAILRAYAQSAILIGGVLIPPFVLFSPFAMLAYYHAGLETAFLIACGFGYPIGQAAIACILLVDATRGIRKADPTGGPPPTTAYPEPPRGRPMLVLSPPREYSPLPPIDDANPVLWKERHAGRAPALAAIDQPLRTVGALATILAITLFVSGGYMLLQRVVRGFDPAEAARMARRDPQPQDESGSLLVAAGVLASGLYLLPLAVGVTAAVAGERIRGTLDALLATPMSRRWMLWSKVRAHTERGLAFAGGAAIALAAGFAADGGTRLGLAALAALAAGTALVVALAAWLSVRCATPLLALRLCMPAVVVVVGLPVLVWNTIDWENVARSTRILTWTAAAFALGAAILGWRAGAEVARGTPAAADSGRG